jgi:polyphosphate:AMP phosphotransferase
MFETAELGHKVDKETFKREEPKLRSDLLDAQFELKQKATFPVLIVIGGVDGAGKGETVNLLNAWMDPRLIETTAFGPQSDEERERPPMWRFWRALPPKGKIGIFFGSWYTQPIVDRVYRRTKSSELDNAIDEIIELERMLVDEGGLLLKFWFHLSKDKQKKRLKALEKDPKTRWRVNDTDWKHFKLYDQFRKVSEHTLRRTSTGDAPWIVVEGEDPEYRTLTVGRAILESMRERLDKPRERPTESDAAPLLSPVDGRLVLDALKLGKRVSKKKYESELPLLQGELNRLTRSDAFKQKHALVAVFEGPDAAGKGGSIRRVTAAIDARQYQIHPIAAPTEEERAQPYLWRFYRHLPRRGQLAIFDRSWYGRVLVERVEGFCSEPDWMRAYGEINDFETELVTSGVIVVKLWLAISQEEQLARFEEREQVGFKRFKITEEDWRNRKRWREYDRAVHDMVERTSTAQAPWTLVEANDKYHARLKVLKTFVKALEERI